VSQFTLHAVVKGNKPDFHFSMKSDQSKAMYHGFTESLKREYLPNKIKEGSFGAFMNVSLVNDGPVTIVLDTMSNNKEDNGNTNITPEHADGQKKRRPVTICILKMVMY